MDRGICAYLRMLRELLAFQVISPSLKLIQGQANGLSSLYSLRAIHRPPGVGENTWKSWCTVYTAYTGWLIQGRVAYTGLYRAIQVYMEYIWGAK